jgi:putative ABC transport system permease protein
MGIIILAIIATSAVALIISNTASGIIENYKQRFGSEVTISESMPLMTMGAGGGGMSGAMPERPATPSPEQYIDFGNSEYLKEAHFSGSIGVYNADGLNFIDEEKGGGSNMMRGFRVSGGPGGNMVFGDDGGGDDDGEPERQYYAKLLGYNLKTPRKRRRVHSQPRTV